MQDQYLQIGASRVRYRSAGTTGSVVICIHGIGRSLEDWSENMAALGERYRVFALDLLGCGLSDKPDMPYTTPFLAKFVQDFMQALNLEKAILIGNSMGGAVALEFAFTYPTMLERLVLVAPAGMGTKGAKFLGLCSLPILGEILTQPSRASAKQTLKALFANPALQTATRAKRDYELAKQPGASKAFLKMLRFMTTNKGLKPAFYNPMLERMPSLKASTLVIWGQQDHILPVEYAPVPTRLIPNAKLEIYNPCGHFPMLEKAKEFNQHVLEFLDN